MRAEMEESARDAAAAVLNSQARGQSMGDWGELVKMVVEGTGGLAATAIEPRKA
jgi:hypothetical protein